MIFNSNLMRTRTKASVLSTRMAAKNDAIEEKSPVLISSKRENVQVSSQLTYRTFAQLSDSFTRLTRLYRWEREMVLERRCTQSWDFFEDTSSNTSRISLDERKDAFISLWPSVDLLPFLLSSLREFPSEILSNRIFIFSLLTRSFSFDWGKRTFSKRKKNHSHRSIRH